MDQINGKPKLAVFVMVGLILIEIMAFKKIICEIDQVFLKKAFVFLYF